MANTFVNILASRQTLEDNLIPEPLAEALLDDHVLDKQEYRDIVYSKKCRAGRNHTMIDILLTKGPTGYQSFHDYVSSDSPWMLKLLDCKLPERTALRDDQESAASQTEITVKPNGRVTDKMIDIIVSDVMAEGTLKWTFLARRLHIPAATITEIERRNKENPWGKMYETLYVWRENLALSHSAKLPAQLTGSWPSSFYHDVKPVDQMCKVLRSEGMIHTANSIEMVRRLDPGGIL